MRAKIILLGIARHNIYIYYIASYNLLRIAKIDSYGYKNFSSELHHLLADPSAQRYMHGLGTPDYSYSYAGKN